MTVFDPERFYHPDAISLNEQAAITRRDGQDWREKHDALLSAAYALVDAGNTAGAALVRNLAEKAMRSCFDAFDRARELERQAAEIENADRDAKGLPRLPDGIDPRYLL